MNSHVCSDCQDIIDGKTNGKHSELIRNGLARSVGHHGNRDDEYYYSCKTCGMEFIGDSMGIWPTKKL